MSGRAAVWWVAGLLAVVVAAVGGGFAWVDREGDRTIGVLRGRLDPALEAVHQFGAAVHGSETAYLGFLVTGDPACLEQSRQEAALAAGRLAVLHKDAAALPVLAAALPAVDTRMHQWLLLTDTAPQAPAGGAAGPQSTVAGDTGPQAQVAARFTASEGLLAAVRELREGLNVNRDTTWSSAFHDRGVAFVFVEVFAAVLLVVLACLAVLTSRRVMNPLADLEERIRQATEGTPDSSGRAPRSGWLTGLSVESERLRQKLVQYRWDSRRHREALEQSGPTTLGLGKILAATGPPGPGVRAHAVIVAAEGIIAGDFVDILALPDGTTALVQGDISGHGVQAGLLGTQAKTAVLSALRLGHGPQAAVHAAWTVLNGQDERFLTLAITVLDPAAQTVSWVNAGHEEPFLRRARGTVERLAATGPLVNPVIDPAGSPWALQRARFGPGDLLVLTTDGLTEARTLAGAPLADREIEKILHTLSAADPRAAVEGIYLAVEQHDIDWQRDDVTIIAATLDTTP